VTDAQRAADLELADRLEEEWHAHPRPSPYVHQRALNARQSLFIPCPEGFSLLTLNTARGRIHWREWAKMTATWRAQGAEVAGVVFTPVPSPVVIVGRPRQARGPLADAGAHMPTLKAIVDGLVDAGWLVEDGPEHVAGAVMMAPVKGKPAGMGIELVPADNGPIIVTPSQTR
jgi:hypothetical protein